MARSVSEWIGKNDDAKAPPKVRQRVLDRDGSKCRLCGTVIMSTDGFELDHVIALINGGENRETNLSAVHRRCHVKKTAVDVRQKAKVAAIKGKHSGAIRPKQSIRSAGFPASPKSFGRFPKQSQPPRAMYAPSLWQPPHHSHPEERD